MVFPKNGKNIFSQKYVFSIIKWFPKIWFLNQKMVSQNIVSQSNDGKKIFFSKNIFSLRMVSQSNDGKKIFSQKYFFSKNGSLNRKWQKKYFLKKYFFSKNGISIVNGFSHLLDIGRPVLRMRNAD